jgi:hypothetical protein
MNDRRGPAQRPLAKFIPVNLCATSTTSGSRKKDNLFTCAFKRDRAITREKFIQNESRIMFRVKYLRGVVARSSSISLLVRSLRDNIHRDRIDASFGMELNKIFI